MKRIFRVLRLFRSRWIFVCAIAAAIVLFNRCALRNSEKSRASADLSDSVYAAQGSRVVALTFDTLRNALIHAISEKDFDGAVAFCNEKAYQITGFYADSVLVRRTSLKVRNQGNRPDSLELQVLHEMEAMAREGQSPAPKVVRDNSGRKVHFFKPIVLQAMCLNCHGKPNLQVQPATLQKIKEFYPEDAAVDYAEGNLRGTWHVVFTQKGQQ